MYTIKYDVRDLREILTALNSNLFKNVLDRTLGRTATRVKRGIQKEIDEKDINYTRNLRQSWERARVSNVEWVVGTEVKYAPYIEFGTKPHIAPYQTIYEWTLKKIRPPRDEATDVAWRIWYKIKTKGTDKREYTLDAIKKFDKSQFVRDLIREWNNAQRNKRT